MIELNEKISARYFDEILSDTIKKVIANIVYMTTFPPLIFF